MSIFILFQFAQLIVPYHRSFRPLKNDKKKSWFFSENQDFFLFAIVPLQQRDTGLLTVFHCRLVPQAGLDLADMAGTQ